MENDNVEGIIEFDPKYTAISGKLPWLVLMIIAFSELQRNLIFFISILLSDHKNIPTLKIIFSYFQGVLYLCILQSQVVTQSRKITDV